jgi:hypothetical protein
MCMYRELNVLYRSSSLGSELLCKGLSSGRRELRATVDDADPSMLTVAWIWDAMTLMQLDAIWFASSCIISAPA